MPKMIVALVVAAVVLATAPAAAAGDVRRPRVRFTTADGAALTATPADAPPAGVRGRAGDDVSGVRRVTVTYCPGSKTSDGSWTCTSNASVSTPTTVTAALSCNDTRRSCTWSAPLPRRPGRYLVFATATDRARRARSTGPIEVYVVSA